MVYSFLFNGSAFGGIKEWEKDSGIFSGMICYHRWARNFLISSQFFAGNNCGMYLTDVQC